MYYQWNETDQNTVEPPYKDHLFIKTGPNKKRFHNISIVLAELRQAILLPAIKAEIGNVIKADLSQIYIVSGLIIQEHMDSVQIPGDIYNYMYTQAWPRRTGRRRPWVCLTTQ